MVAATHGVSERRRAGDGDAVVDVVSLGFFIVFTKPLWLAWITVDRSVGQEQGGGG
jgi:hypothetical protein